MRNRKLNRSRNLRAGTGTTAAEGKMATCFLFSSRRSWMQVDGLVMAQQAKFLWACIPNTIRSGKKSDELNLLSLLGDRKKKERGCGVRPAEKKESRPSAESHHVAKGSIADARLCSKPRTGVVVQHASKWTASAASSGSSRMAPQRGGIFSVLKSCRFITRRIC